MTRLLPMLLLAAFAFPAAALTPAQAPGATDEAAKPASAPAEAATGVDRACLRHTGTRIRYRDGRCPATAGRSWSRDDLLSTGRTNVVDALRALDPSIR